MEELKLKGIERGKNIEGILRLLFILTLLVVVLGGCDKTEGNKKQEDEKNTKKGRYMEESIPLPEDVKGNEVFSIIEGKDKVIELFSKKGDTKNYKHYVKTENGWKEKSLNWLKDTKLSQKGNNIEQILYGEDRNYYVLTYDVNKKAHTRVYKVDENNNLKEVLVEYLEQSTSVSKDGVEAYPYVTKMSVLSNGNYLFEEYGGLTVVDGKSGEVIKKIEPGNDNNSSYAGSEINNSSYKAVGNEIIVNLDKSKLSLFDGESGKTLKTIDMEEAANTYHFYKKEDETIILVNSNGIQQIKKDGSLWETIVDGGLNSMSMPSLYIESFFVRDGEKDSYIVVYHDKEGTKQMMQYQYNKSVSAVPKNEITVYSLKENSTIRQAISTFQRSNTDVKVNYIVSMDGEGENKSDYIKALNTELLNGNGADVLVLDGLPVESYIEKGILVDLKDFYTKLSEEEDIPNNIMKNYLTDNKLYSLPCRFTIPIIYGEKKAVNAWTNLNEILNYVKSNSEKMYVDGISKEQLLKIFLSFEKESFISEENQLKEDEFKNVLEKIKELSEHLKPSYEAKTVINNSMEYNQGKVFNSYTYSYFDNISEAGLEEVGCIQDSVLFLKMIEEKKGIYNLVNNLFVPSGQIGINKASKKEELAKEFLKILFSEDVQSIDVNDGFPVNGTSLNKWFEKENETFGIAVSTDNSDSPLFINWPDKKTREQLCQNIKKADQKFEHDNTLIDIIIAESKKYIDGSASIEQVSNSAKSKVDTYLAE